MHYFECYMFVIFCCLQYFDTEWGNSRGFWPTKKSAVVSAKRPLKTKQMLSVTLFVISTQCCCCLRDIFACLQIIFSDECTEAEGHSWHTKHFVCCDCESPLGGQRYIMTDGRPFCCVCYERLYAAVCATCQQQIHVTDGHMVHGSRRWHTADSCFRCDFCACSLLGCPFVAVPGKDAIFCADCGITYKAADSASYMDKYDGVMGGNYLLPSSPMMKVQEPCGNAFHSKSDGAVGRWYAGQNQSEETPLKVASKFFSPHSSPLQCKPFTAECQTHSACTDPASCCDDHRLSAEFQACTSSRDDPNSGVLATELSSQNEKSQPRISPIKISISDFRSATESDVKTSTIDDAVTSITSPKLPLLVASGADFLDNAEEINAGLEELIVEPLWNRKEPEGLAAEGTDVVGVPDDVRQKSRKSKNLNVRFDPSTKDPCSPVAHGAYCERWRPSCHRSLDDSDISYVSCGSQCRAAGQRVSASVRIGRRRFGCGRHGEQNGMCDDAGSRNHRASVNQGWWIDGEDDYDHCSTCSSSSSDSDFDYGDAAFSSRTVPAHSQTLPQRHRNASAAVAAPLSQQVQRSRKHKKKHCTVS